MPLTTRAGTSLLETKIVGEVAVVRLIGPSILDDRELRLVNDGLRSLYEEHGHDKVLLNLGSVTRLTSALLAKLLKFHLRLRQAGGRLTLCEVRPEVWEVFEITHLTRIFDVYPTEWQALLSF
jgi:anti-sigma B factor antagonist